MKSDNVGAKRLSAEEVAYALGNDLANAGHALSQQRQFSDKDLPIFIKHLTAFAEERVKEVVAEHMDEQDGECYTNTQLSLAKEQARAEERAYWQEFIKLNFSDPEAKEDLYVKGHTEGHKQGLEEAAKRVEARKGILEHHSDIAAIIRALKGNV